MITFLAGPLMISPYPHRCQWGSCRVSARPGSISKPSSVR